MINLRMRLDQLEEVEAIREHDEAAGPATATVTRTSILDELLTRGIAAANASCTLPSPR